MAWSAVYSAASEFGSAPASKSCLANSKWAFSIAKRSGVNFKLSRPNLEGCFVCMTPLISHPASSSSRTTSLRPSRTAKKSAVHPEDSSTSILAPAAISASTTPAWPSAEAHMRAVWPFRSWALTLAPRDNSDSTGPSLPVRDAVIRTVSPLGSESLGSAPSVRSNSTSSPLPFWQARASGVTP
jgi:hypothetical protein